MKNHYIARCLSKPWEVDRTLRYVDVGARRVGKNWTSSLFARTDVYSPELEAWLGRMVETPISKARDHLIASAPSLERWEEYRAAHLVILLGGARVAQAHGRVGRAESSLEQLAAMPDATIDELVRAHDAQCAIVALDSPAGAPLFLPSTGVFGLPISLPGTATGFGFALALPLSTERALLAVPREAAHAILAWVRSSPGLLQAASVGLLPYADRVVVPPQVASVLPEPELVSAVLEMQERMRELGADFAALHDLVGRSRGWPTRR